MEDLLKLANSEASIAAIIVIAVAIVIVMVAGKYFDSQQWQQQDQPETVKALADLAMAITKLNQFLELTEKSNEELRRRDNELMQDILKETRSGNQKIIELYSMCKNKKCPQVANMQ